MTKKQTETIKEWIEDNKKWKWKLDEDYPMLSKKNKFYHHSIDLDKLLNCCVESDELCLAFKRGCMVWVMEDSIVFEHEPTNPLFKKVIQLNNK